ncbi:MAG: MlaD family protein [Ignavibacteriaceae bacterium]
MKKDTTNKIRLGIFITLGVVILIVGIYFIGEKQQLFRSTFRLTGVFRDVAGLQAGNNVRLSGINVGTVENIMIISDTSVRVEVVIDEETRRFIKKDAVATIGSEGLMGNKILIINPGTGGKRIIEDNDVVETAPPVNLDEIFVSLKTTVDNASFITNDLAHITNNIQSGKGTIGRLLMDHSLAENFDASITSLNQSLSGMNDIINVTKNSFAENFDSTFINLREGSVSLKDGLSEFREIMVLTNDKIAVNFDSTFANLKKGSEGFNVLMEKAKKSWLLWGF